jgi:gamma-glutamylcyclotransferase (GGCT)/AIG2-like uncharacterized protein YtfP
LPPKSLKIAKSLSMIEQSSSHPSSRELDLSPGYMFFYGTLSDPEVLQAVLKLGDLPFLEQGYITGYSIKLWGIYPTLIPSSDTGAKILGNFWNVDSESQMMKLSEYETSAYKIAFVTIHRGTDGGKESGRVFCWNGDPESHELEDGSFDLARYQKFFKPSIVKQTVKS